MKKSIIKIICFGIIFIIGMQCFIRTYSFKYSDGIYGLTAFYNQDRNINDVIFVGSSHIFEGVNTEVLWDEYGIASFDLGGSIQPIWNSYYYIQEALKTQNPQLIVLDLYGVLQTEDYIDNSRIIKNTYGMKSSADKMEAIRVSSQEALWNDYLWEIPTYHARYKDLDESDFLPNLGIPNWEAWKGFIVNTYTIALEQPEGFQTEETLELTEKVEDYLCKICQICKENNVDLLLIKTPYITDINSTMKYNRAAEVAREYGVPFVNFNYHYDEMGLDFSTDMGDGMHLNYNGNVKFSRYLAEYIKSNYDIPDQRSEKGYESYEIISKDCLMRTNNALVYDTYDIDIFLEKIQNENYVVIYSVSGDYKNAINYALMNKRLCAYGINLDDVEAASVWIIQDGEKLYASGNSYDYLWYKELAAYKDIEVGPGEDWNSAPSIIYNREELIKGAEGINIVVYDSVTEAIVDVVSFPILNGKIQNEKQELLIR